MRPAALRPASAPAMRFSCPPPLPFVRKLSSGLFADEADGLRRVRFGHLAEADQSRALQLHAVAPDEGLLAIERGHESAIGTLVDQQELAARQLDARVDARDQVAA